MHRLNSHERAFLALIKYDLHINVDTFERWQKKLKRTGAAFEEQQQGISPVPAYLRPGHGRRRSDCSNMSPIRREAVPSLPPESGSSRPAVTRRKSTYGLSRSQTLPMPTLGSSGSDALYR